MRLVGKVALITGAGSGIGRATACLFAEEGSKIVVADYSAEGGHSTVDQINAQGGDATFVQVDVTKASEVDLMVKTAVSTYGKLNILHNNAGIFPVEGPSHEMDEDLWDRVIDTNLKGMWLSCKYAIPELVKQEGSTIVNTASMAGIRGRAYRIAYCSSKGGVIMLTKALAMELSPHGVRVNCICPGAVNTPLIRPEGITPEEFGAREIPRAPTPRVSEPKEQAQAALFLASQESSYVNGQAMMVDGGDWAGTTQGIRATKSS